MASTSSSSKPNSNMLTTIKVNSPNVGHLFFSTRIPSPSSFPDVTGHRPTLRFDPSDPPDLQQLFERVAISSEGFLKSFIKMFDNLGSDGYVDLAMEMGHQFTEQGMMNPVVFLTGIIDEYAQAGKTNEALYVFRMMLVREGSVPNVYTYSVIIKALAADKDPNFHGVAKEIVMEMMRKGMQPTASAYVAVYEAFAGEVKMEEAKRFVEEMKGNGFVADRKARIGIRRVLEVKGAMVQSIIDILFDE